MAFEVITTNPGVTYEVENTDIVILPNGVLYTSTGDGFDATPDAGTSLNGVTLQIHGQIYANDIAIDFWGSLGGVNVYNNSTIFVGSTGVVSGTSLGFKGESGANNQIQNYGQISGRTAIESYGGANSLILNGGLISGTSEYGILVYGEVNTGSAPNTVITNLAGGTISGQIAAISLSDLVGGSSITNHGMITSSLGVGIDLSSVTTGQSPISIANWGTIQGNEQVIVGSLNSESVVNRGLISGDVDLGDGDDLVDNRNGTIQGSVDLGFGNDTYNGAGGEVTGTVFGGDGNDSFFGNATLAEVFDGGVGTDTLDFRFLGGVTLALDNSVASAGSAVGDTYFGFENVNGSNGGDDVIIGSNANNLINGFGGNDVLDGLKGTDILRGGLGVDVLTGGQGNDTFRFNNINEFGDTITDFSSTGANKDDRFQIAAGVGGGLVAGVLAANQFQSRADNVAQDADDRFVFRTTDKTLWFDADGNGSGAAIMVADLQANATMTNLDIVIF